MIEPVININEKQKNKGGRPRKLEGEKRFNKSEYEKKYQRERYHNDAEYREKKKEYNRLYKVEAKKKNA